MCDPKCRRPVLLLIDGSAADSAMTAARAEGRAGVLAMASKQPFCRTAVLNLRDWLAR